MSIWDFPSDLFFVYWGVKNWVRALPDSAMTVVKDGERICGYVPKEWDGTLEVFTVQ